MSNQGLAFEKWEDTRQVLDAERIYYSNKIERNEEYRNILYGNNEGLKKELSRFALLQSRQYQNIPRTIQNVFLNSKLEAEFIKQTIIMSLNEEDISIDLQSYTYHLKNFEGQLAEIHQYKLPSTQAHAENAIRLHLAIRHLESEKNQQSLQLAWSAANLERVYPNLLEQKEIAETAKASLQEKSVAATVRFRNKTEKIRGEISIQEEKLRQAKEKTEYYNSRNIERLVSLVNGKKDVEAQFNRCANELQLLTAHYGEVTQKYASLLTALEQNNKAFEQERKEELLLLRQRSFSEEKIARKWLEKQLAELKVSNSMAIAQAREVVEHKRTFATNERLKKEAVKHRRFFEQELAELQKQISGLELYLNKGEQLLRTLADREQTLRKQWELDEAGVKQESQRQSEKAEESIASNKRMALDLQAKIENGDDAFYGWLNRNYEGWENTIGRVSSEALLFSHSLAPSKGADAEKSLYGVDIDLDKLNIQVKSMTDYSKERDDLVLAINKLQRDLKNMRQQETDQLDKLRKKYQPQIKDCKDAIKEQQYLSEQQSTQLQEAGIKKKDFEARASEEKAQALKNIDAAIVSATEALISAEADSKNAEIQWQKQEKAKEREYEKKLAVLEQAIKHAEAMADESIRKYRTNYALQKEELSARQEQELKGKGADTNRIAELNAEVSELQLELQRIEDSRDTVTEYKKDKRELIDKIEEFKSLRASLEQQYTIESQKHKLFEEKLQQELAANTERMEQLAKQIDHSREDLDQYKSFTNSDAYNSIDAPHKEERKENSTDKRPGSLISDIQRSYYNALKRLEELKEALNNFLGIFSVNNIFKFRTSLSQREEYLQFAEELNEFINNSKIEEYENRVNERFTSIIHSLGKDTGLLMSKGGEIQKVINEINKDFDNKNFAGVIRKIELRLDESSNPVVQLLLQIQQFNNENPYGLGALNLFSGVGQESSNRRASELLKQFARAITEYKKEVISLSDSFELKFRIEENENDTGWVERLSNVGSEGTDVLVKAMINIMLLNVFKQGASRRFKDFRLHCMMDEIGKLHPNNVRGILQFANDRNINLINGSPTENNAADYKHVYKLEKDSKRYTRVKRIITNHGFS